MALACLAMALQALVLSPPATAQEVKRIPFISVAPPRGDYEAADLALIDYLRRNAKLNLAWLRASHYHKAIAEVVPKAGKANPLYIARLTPYPCVAAELLGAKFEILATYSSRATKTEKNPKALTYYSYFVVNAKRTKLLGSVFPENPSLRDIDEFLTKGTRTFIYHDKFSTSSYFIPLNYFRKRRIFVDTNQAVDTNRTVDTDQPKDTFIKVIPPGKEKKSSSDSVDAVLAGRADLAAVWDGTKKEVEAGKPGPLRFIPIEPALPNDLLVASASLPSKSLDKLRNAIKEMPCGEQDLFPGDFECWHVFADAQEAREALADLRRLAVEPPAPVTIQISGLPEGSPYLEAARQAVRLAGTEFVLYDPDYHGWADLDWKLKVFHDGALELTSTVNGISGKVTEQTIPISFTDVTEDLTRRIVDVIHTRLNRIRYVWPFEDSNPTILRDVGFVLKTGSRVWVQQITWIDPERNKFEFGDEFEAKVSGADAYKFILDPEPFQKVPGSQKLEIDPMSNSAFRVILERPTTEKPLFRFLTAAFVALFALGGVLAGVDLYRARGIQNEEET
jgi:ABC-type phosphate/phosphonate transport system substrate-binding protein